MKYINIATNSSRVMAVLRSAFSIKKLEDIIPNQYSSVTITNCVEVLNKTVLCNSYTINKNQVLIRNYYTGDLINISYQQGNKKSSELIRTGILRSEKDFSEQ